MRLNPQLNEIEAQFYIDASINTILSITNRKTLLPQMEMLVIQLAIFLITGIQRQGITSRSEGAISESYADNAQIPQTLMTQIQAYRLLRPVQYGS